MHIKCAQHSACVSVLASALIGCDFSTASLESLGDALHQRLLIEGLLQVAHGAGVEYPCADRVVGVNRYEDYWNAQSLISQTLL